MSILVIKSNIADFSGEAIVNSANTSLLAGGGVCGAIHAKAGKELEACCRNLAPCVLGMLL